MRTKYWSHTLPGVVAAMGWAFIFTYALLRALAGHWWAMASVLVITLLAGALNLAASLQTTQKKKVTKKPTLPPFQGPGVH